MNLSQLASDAREALEVPRDLLLGRYPDFVTGGPLARGDVPVFVFHSLEPESFSRRLRHLADNDYVTLSIHEYLSILLGARHAPDRAVLLTLDDGRGSVWSVGYPLLNRFGMKAVVFLVPGRMRSRPGPLPPTWADVLGGGADEAGVRCREEGDGALLSWEEVEALARSGLLDFQSHTLTHARIHVAPRLAGFATPWSRRGYDAFDQPLVRQGERDLLGEEVPLGTPLFRSAPRTSESRRFFEHEDVRRASVEAVAEGGGEAFFRRRGWKARLERQLDRRRLQGRLETPEEQARAIERELRESARTIEERTGRPVRHLCYPWHAAGPTARALAYEAGYRTSFCGKVPGVSITRSGDDPLRIARLGEDYLEMLPGRGRLSLGEVLRRKWVRRFAARA